MVQGWLIRFAQVHKQRQSFVDEKWCTRLARLGELCCEHTTSAPQDVGSYVDNSYTRCSTTVTKSGNPVAPVLKMDTIGTASSSDASIALAFDCAEISFVRHENGELKPSHHRHYS